jgi:hypothetical protein
VRVAVRAPSVRNTAGGFRPSAGETQPGASARPLGKHSRGLPPVRWGNAAGGFRPSAGETQPGASARPLTLLSPTQQGGSGPEQAGVFEAHTQHSDWQPQPRAAARQAGQPLPWHAADEPGQKGQFEDQSKASTKAPPAQADSGQSCKSQSAV